MSVALKSEAEAEKKSFGAPEPDADVSHEGREQHVACEPRHGSVGRRLVGRRREGGSG
mgnify:FL=1